MERGSEDMSEKVKLPFEIANSIENLRKSNISNEDIIYKFAWETDNGFPDLVAYAAYDFDALLLALVNGYEVEETPEDKLRHYYNELQHQMPNSHAAQSADTVIVVLNILGIKIEGVNA